MAIQAPLGGIRRTDYQFTTVIPMDLLMELTIGGLAFEPKGRGSGQFNHLEPRVKELAGARKFQRNFYAPAMVSKKVTDPETGEKRTVREATGWSSTAKHKNAKGDLRKYIEGPFLDDPPAAGALPSFSLYCPEHLEGIRREEFDAYMAGEFYVYNLDRSLKFMLADGESRHLGVDLILADPKVSGNLKEKLKAATVSVDVYHGIEPAHMGQIYADLNGHGVNLTKTETQAHDIRDPWVRATKQIFDQLKVPLAETGRQVTAATMANNQHLMLGQAVSMVRAIGMGTASKALSKKDYVEMFEDPKTYDRLVAAGVKWLTKVLDHFEAPTLDNGERDASFLSDTDLVIRSVPVKVALGLMGRAWFEIDMPKQHEYIAVLGQINWRVDQRWQGIAGKVRPATRKVEGKNVAIDDEFRLASASGKEIGSAAFNALTKPDTISGRAVRGLEAN